MSTTVPTANALRVNSTYILYVLFIHCMSSHALASSGAGEVKKLRIRINR